MFRKKCSLSELQCFRDHFTAVVALMDEIMVVKIVELVMFCSDGDGGGKR